MNELDPLEKQLQSWTPRRPSAEIAGRLFGQTETPRPVQRRTPAAWNWLTPVAACFLAVVMVVGNNHRPLGGKDHTRFFATMMVNAASSNWDGNLAGQSFALNKEDMNLEWNVWLLPNLKTTNLSSDIAAFEAPKAASTNR